MVGPILGLAARLLVGQGARQAITRQAVRAGVAQGGRNATRPAIQAAADRAINARASANLGRIAVGVGAYQAAASAASFGMRAAQVAVGNAIKRTDFQVLLANLGFGFALERRQAANAVAATRIHGIETYGEDIQDWYRVKRDRVGLTVQYRGLSEQDRARLVRVWERYGYMVGEGMEIPRLDPMTVFSYWQLREPTVLGAMPANAKLDVIAAFERGTTVWTDLSRVGNSSGNSPRSGVSY